MLFKSIWKDNTMKINDLEIFDLNEEDIELEDVELEEVDSYDEELSEVEHDEEFDWKKELRSWIFTLGFTVAMIFILKNYIIINASVPTGSMENTIMPGDNLLGYRLAYLTEEPERGDVIFFYFPDDESQKYVKRIVGLPGESVYIIDGEIYIDDAVQPLKESYLKEEWLVGVGPYEFQVPEDSYLVLGDNRNSSQDARYWMNSYVTKDKIIGKAIFTYFPFSRWGIVE